MVVFAVTGSILIIFNCNIPHLSLKLNHQLNSRRGILGSYENHRGQMELPSYILLKHTFSKSKKLEFIFFNFYFQDYGYTPINTDQKSGGGCYQKMAPIEKHPYIILNFFFLYQNCRIF